MPITIKPASVPERMRTPPEGRVNIFRDLNDGQLKAKEPSGEVRPVTPEELQRLRQFFGPLKEDDGT